jgi:hypothetical protein
MIDIIWVYRDPRDRGIREDGNIGKKIREWKRTFRDSNIPLWWRKR